MRSIREAFFASRGGHGQLVLISGEAGFGKSALVDRFCFEVRTECRVLVGRCDPLTTPRPLGPLLDVAEHLGPRIEMLLGAGNRPQTVFTEALKQLTFEPSLFVVEDLHWADEATLDLIRYLGRRISQSNLTVLCTYRDEELDSQHPLRVAIGDLGAGPGISRVALEPLTVDAVRLLCGDTDLDAASLHLQTGGNPFFVNEILSAGQGHIPATVRDAILARVARLSPPAREALESAAVVGGRIDSRFLNAAFEIDQAAVIECTSKGFLISDRDSLTFRHELVRAAILEAVPGPTRAIMHAKVLGSLRQSGVMPDELAALTSHAVGAGDEASVLEFAPAAARWASGLGAHREAAAHYATAINVAVGLSDQDRAELTEARADELFISGDNAQASGLYRDAATAWRALKQTERQGGTLRRLSGTLFRLGSYQEAYATADQSLDMLIGLPASAELAWAYSNKAHLLAVSDRCHESTEWSGRALALAKRLGDQELAIYALNDLGAARLWLGDPRGRGDLETSARLAAEFSYPDHYLRAYCNLAVHDVEHYEPTKANSYLAVAIDFSAGREMLDVDTHLLATRALSRCLSGRWADSVGGAREALARRVTLPGTTAMALLCLGLVAARTGNRADATHHLEQAMGFVADRYPPLLWRLHLGRAETAWLSGDRLAMQLEARASIEERVGDQIPFVTAECNYWLWRAGEQIDKSLPMEGPFALMVAGKWEAAAKDWEERGCPYETAISLMECKDPAAVSRAAEIFSDLGAKPALAMARQKLRQLGVTVGRRGPTKATRSHPWGLTDRETDVLTLMGEGFTNAQIAARLFIAPKTAEHHVSRILTKLDAKNRMDAVRMAADHAVDAEHPEVPGGPGADQEVGVSGRQK